jgi:hypothetical protein
MPCTQTGAQGLEWELCSFGNLCTGRSYANWSSRNLYIKPELNQTNQLTTLFTPSEASWPERAVKPSVLPRQDCPATRTSVTRRIIR